MDGMLSDRPVAGCIRGFRKGEKFSRRPGKSISARHHSAVQLFADVTCANKLNYPNGGAKAVEALQAAAPYEFGAQFPFSTNMYPAYFRGMAYLAERKG